MWQRQTTRFSLKDFIKHLETDIHHANNLCMLMECQLQAQRKASLHEFYAVIYPMLKQLEGSLVELKDENLKRTVSKVKDSKKPCTDHDREDECGICMETDCKIVLPICGHSMCVRCHNDWYVRSQSCPFCRGSLKRVKLGDLWVLISNLDVADTMTLAKENLQRFYVYIDKLPLSVPDKLPLSVPDDNLLMMYNYNYLM